MTEVRASNIYTAILFRRRKIDLDSQLTLRVSLYYLHWIQKKTQPTLCVISPQF
jgi:hypothetical protein